MNRHSRSVLVLEQGTPSCEAARSMNERNCGYAVVSNGRGRMVGMVTDRDLACGILGERLNAHSPISEVMSSDLKYIDDSQDVDSALKVMQEYGVRRVPIIHENPSGSQKCVGIYTFDEIILAEETELSGLKRILRRQLPNRMRSPSMDSEQSEVQREEQFNRFNRILADEIGIQGELAENIVYHLIRSIVQRVPKDTVRNFILDLPALIHEDFLRVEPLAETNFSVYAIELELARRYKLKKKKFAELLPKFWYGLGHFVRKRNLKAVYESLPKDLQQALMRETAPNPQESLDNIRYLQRVPLGLAH